MATTTREIEFYSSRAGGTVRAQVTRDANGAYHASDAWTRGATLAPEDAQFAIEAAQGMWGWPKVAGW